MDAHLLHHHDDANELVGEIHDRMPVILPPDAYDRWLANIAPKGLAGRAEDRRAERRYRFRLNGFFGGGLSDHDTASNAAKL